MLRLQLSKSVYTLYTLYTLYYTIHLIRKNIGNSDYNLKKKEFSCINASYQTRYSCAKAKSVNYLISSSPQISTTVSQSILKIQINL